MRNALRNLLWAAGGAAVMWIAFRFSSGGAGEAGPAAIAPAERAIAGTGARPRTGGAARDAESAPREPAPVAAPAGSEPPAPSSPASRTAASGGAPTVVWFPPKELLGSSTDIPNRRPDDSAGRKAAADLLDQSRVTCDFGAGMNAGVRFGDTLLVGVGAQWQGGLMVYDLLEPGAGRARLIGTVGGTGSPNGETKVQLMLYGTRIYFLGLQPNGTYALTTIYDELDDMGRHVAVMSRHENGIFTYGTQWLGVCY